MYLKDERKPVEVRRSHGPDFEMVAWTDSPSKRRYLALYRRPGDKVSKELMTELTDELSKPQLPVILGDTNINTDLKRPTPGALHSLLRRRGMRQRVPFITRPPRGRPNPRSLNTHGRDIRRGSCIDHCWSCNECVCTPLPTLSHLSDHKGILIRTSAEPQLAGIEEKLKCQNVLG